MTSAQKDSLLATLKSRFEKNMGRHKGGSWEKVAARLNSKSRALQSLFEMEQSGGEPDVVGQATKSGEVLFIDCSEESPAGRRSVCYDREALNARKKFKPKNSAVDMADAMGAELLTFEEYQMLQSVGAFDLKTSSWLKTPEKIRELGGAIFGDRRYDTVFLYHNGADSYYAARGFRCLLRV